MANGNAKSSISAKCSVRFLESLILNSNLKFENSKWLNQYRIQKLKMTDSIRTEMKIPKVTRF